MSTRVVVVGGGYGGVAVAKALDAWADVVLVEPKDAFVHNVGALRAVVDPDWMPKIFFPYGRLLARGRVVQDRAVRVEPGQVTLASGERLAADYVVLSTGSTYPFPAKSDATSTATAQQQYRAASARIASAERVLLLGAGAVGLEFAGEIMAAWPDKRVTIVDPAPAILADYDPELQREVTRQLQDLGVELLLGSPLVTEPPTAPGSVGTFTVTTAAGAEVTADLWFRCYGVKPVTDYLAGSLVSARTPDGQLLVNPQLQVRGHQSVFALGDITAIDEQKRAAAAQRHAMVVAANIKALAQGEAMQGHYTPGPVAITLPLGPRGGAGQVPGGGLVGADVVAERKGADLMVGRFAELFGEVRQ